MQVMYIAGPFSDYDTIHGIQANVLKASRAALRAWATGFAVICPHKNTEGFQHVDSISYETWTEGYLEILSKCDAICMVGYWLRSHGARQEYLLARRLGLRVYRHDILGDQVLTVTKSDLKAYDANVGYVPQEGSQR